MNPLTSALGAALALLAAAALPAAEPGLLTPADLLPAEPFFSGDRAVCVRAPRVAAGYRAPVLGFVERTRDEFLRAFRLALAPSAYILDIQVGAAADGDTRVIASQGRGLDGRPIDVIRLPAPETSDLDAIRRAVSLALLRAYLSSIGGDRDSLGRLPPWLVSGLWLFIGGRERTADFDRAWGFWIEGRLPIAPKLWSADSPANKDPGLQAALIACLTDRRGDGKAFETLLADAAAGRPYRWETVAWHLAGTRDPWAFDRFMDRWMILESHRVLTPGLTTRGVASRFRSSLRLYPVYSEELPPLFLLEGAEFRPAIRYAARPDIRDAAAKQSLRIRTAAAGRDEKLAAVAESYARFTDSLAAGKTPEAGLIALLDRADALRRDYERELEEAHGTLRTVR